MCDAAFYKDKITVVTGGGDTAFGDALLLSRFCKKVYLVHRRDSFRAGRALQNRVFDRLFEAAEIAKFTKTELSEYWDSLKNFRDWYSVISTAEKKGREEGLKEANLNNARNLKKLGVAVDIISQATGLTPEEVEQIPT